MHIHILGIAGTFMAGIALLAKQQGHQVTGTDANVYPPMSDVLDAAGIAYNIGYAAEHLSKRPDLVIMGNALSRGNPMVEYCLAESLPMTSGPRWLYDAILKDKQVLAVAGTHGKTTTSSMLAWILEQAGLNPSFLIGGKPGNFPGSARLTDSPYFVIEADEYDTAFFDKRAKFVHYWPSRLLINNLEFDHADIYANLTDIQKQFHHLIRLVPEHGTILIPGDDLDVQETIQMGCWTATQTFGQAGHSDWAYQLLEADGSSFYIQSPDKKQFAVQWPHFGEHNVSNATAAVALASSIGVAPETAVQALSCFIHSKRRLEHKGTVSGIDIYEDFAHHPTAITTTLKGIAVRFPKRRIVVMLELRSHTMKKGTHKQALGQALSAADCVFVYAPKDSSWCHDAYVQDMHADAGRYTDYQHMLQDAVQALKAGDVLLLMSNGGFGGIPSEIVSAIERQNLVSSLP